MIGLGTDKAFADFPKLRFVGPSGPSSRRWGHDPSAASEFAYSSMRLILRGIEMQKGNISDEAALVKAMTQVDMSLTTVPLKKKKSSPAGSRKL